MNEVIGSCVHIYGEREVRGPLESKHGKADTVSEIAIDRIA